MPLDIGFGLLVGILLHVLSGFNYLLCLAIGVLACLLPDLDYVWRALVSRKPPTSTHRDGLHYPLLFIPIVGMIGLAVDWYICLVLMLGALIHFLHDSIGVGWGVKWLFPFKKKSYMFLYRAGLPTNKEMPKKLLYSWTDKERDKAMHTYGDKNWIKHIYYNFHIFGIIEYAVLILGVAAAFAFS